MNLKRIVFPTAIKSTSQVTDPVLQTAYTNDLNSVEIVFDLTDCTDEELVGATASIFLRMRDGSVFQDDVVVTSKTVSYIMTENQGNHSGVARVQLSLKIGDAEYASPVRKFTITSGLDSFVPMEILIKDWTALTTEARAFIDESVENEELRMAQYSLIEGKLANGEFIGPQGIQGPQGLKGDPGIQGEIGPKGDPGNTTAATETTLGGIKAKAKTTESLEAAIDANGKIFVPETTIPANLKTKSVAFYIGGDLTVEADCMATIIPQVMRITGIKAVVSTAPVGANVILDINVNGTSVYTTQANRPNIADGATSVTASLPNIVDLVLGDVISVDVDQIGITTAGANLSIVIICEV